MRSRLAGIALAAAVLCAAAAGMAVLASAAGSQASTPDVKTLKKKAVKKTIKAVKRKLPDEKAPELEPAAEPVKVKVTSCKQRRKKGEFAGFKCSWNAHGELPGRCC